MKQRITAEQLSELSDKAKEKLREWWKPVVGDGYANWNQFSRKYDEGLYSLCPDDHFHDEVPDKKNGDLPLLSIGQMIELLGKDALTIQNATGRKFKGYISWFVHTKYELSVEGRMDKKIFEERELVDALWEAVKYILEKEV